ncbi:carbamoyl phosphate synthase small subunit [Exiguobacterium sp. SH0S2]|uniref:carbamoyl phosphate synthase small subunit n=1 Tax=Exiguobacterium sp. SH0S2 TaxID=2510950 RepID=UPI00103BC825|nr:carbamoyl phosphate synthase small subunit [Exiguobacterium sp. SH0S2]TCI65512.1 carbamoyl phosphate synthase small subunit [Exiguobacterium sp. SH0S2]
MKRTLWLEDGTAFVGKAFGANAETIGEVVFQTGMTGYQEILSDPSYCDQLIVLTNPLIGNYGVNREDFETTVPMAKALIVKEACDLPSNFRSTATLPETLERFEIPGLEGVDTRMLTRHLRSRGVMRGVLIDGESTWADVSMRFEASFPTDQVARVSTKRAYVSTGSGRRIALIDFGAKLGIMRELLKRDCEVVVLPHDVTAEEVMRYEPDGVMLSNGPGDPKDVPTALPLIEALMPKLPMFGICLGHQLIALASGANTFKLPFGHRGANHPVLELETGAVTITSQNHGYAVDETSLLETPLIVTHRAVNDGTIEGIKHLHHPTFSVQYHPEAAPGPYDANDLFDRFMTLVNENRQKVGM